MTGIFRQHRGLAALDEAPGGGQEAIVDVTHLRRRQLALREQT
ncbi:MAG: hypothetical protein ACLP19_05835 [Xanthobacteraceae bacterium]